MIRVHTVLQKGSEVSLLVSYYTYQCDLFGISDEVSEEDHTALLLRYQDWMTAGEEADAEVLPFSMIRQVIGRCEIRTPLCKPEGFLGQSDSVELNSVHGSFTAEWAYTKCELLATDSERPQWIFEMRSMRNRLYHVGLDSMDLSKLQVPFTVHHYNSGIGGSTVGFNEMGFQSLIAVEPDEKTSQSWKVLAHW